MIQAKAVHSQADAHRNELMVAAESRRHARPHASPMRDAGSAQRSAAGVPVAGGRAVRRARAPRIGAWLIDFGVRLGGTSVRTS